MIKPRLMIYPVTLSKIKKYLKKFDNNKPALPICKPLSKYIGLPSCYEIQDFENGGRNFDLKEFNLKSTWYFSKKSKNILFSGKIRFPETKSGLETLVESNNTLVRLTDSLSNVYFGRIIKLHETNNKKNLICGKGYVLKLDTSYKLI